MSVLVDLVLYREFAVEPPSSKVTTVKVPRESKPLHRSVLLPAVPSVGDLIDQAGWPHHGHEDEDPTDDMLRYRVEQIVFRANTQEIQIRCRGGWRYQ